VAVALCWVESDQAAPPTRQSANFWLLPRLAALQLRIIEQLTAGFAHISAPRQVSRSSLSEGQCCGSEIQCFFSLDPRWKKFVSGIRCLFDPWILDPEWKIWIRDISIPDPQH
jgi:hypothetical protein